MGIKSKVNGLIIGATPSTIDVTKLGRGKYADYEQYVDKKTAINQKSSVEKTASRKKEQQGKAEVEKL